jgi:hypothetical protein
VWGRRIFAGIFVVRILWKPCWTFLAMSASILSINAIPNTKESAMNTNPSSISPVAYDAGDATITDYAGWVSLHIAGQPTGTVHGTVSEACDALNRFRRESPAEHLLAPGVIDLVRRGEMTA